MPQTRPLVYLLNEGKGSNVRPSGLTTLAGCCDQACRSFRPGVPGLFPGLAARNQGEGQSQSPLPLPAGSHIRGRHSAPMWEGNRSCFHFLSYSSRTVAADTKQHPSSLLSSSKAEAEGQRECEEDTLDISEQTQPPLEGTNRDKTRTKNLL